MKSTHIFGPWIYDPDNDRFSLVVRDKNSRIIARVEDNRSFTLEECEANARLIAAAPSLLQQLRLYVIACECGNHSSGEINFQRACHRCTPAVRDIEKVGALP